MWPSELRYKPMFDEHLQPRLHVYPKSGQCGGVCLNTDVDMDDKILFGI